MVRDNDRAVDQAFETQRRVWETLGKDDPFWAVLSVDGKRGNKWDIEEFLAIGRADVARYTDLLRKAGWSGEPFESALDFGCGVGRLTAAWRRHARRVTGVDVSSAMLQTARQLHEDPALDFIHNPHADLRILDGSRFDLVFSHICLQHIPPSHALEYLREFGRVCRPGGWVAFQLPSRAIRPNRAALARKWIVEHLPFGLGALYRKWRHGASSAFDVFSIPADQVEAVFAKAEFVLMGKEPDASAGETFESSIYIFRRKAE